MIGDDLHLFASLDTKYIDVCVYICTYLEHDDGVARLDRREPVRHNQDGPALARCVV